MEVLLLLPEPTPSSAFDWGRVTTAKWWLSHLFALSLIAGFLWAGFWQVDRLQERIETNELVESRALAEPIDLDSALAGDAGAQDPAALDFVAVAATGRFVQDEVVRVANRSFDGAAGDWLVGLFETRAGERILVNRGFITRVATPADAPTGEVVLEGWLRESREKGFIGAADTGSGERVPRLNVDDIGARLGESVAPVWLQQSNDFVPELFPSPLPLDSLDRGNHLSYAVQWFIFAALSIVIYGLLVRRVASGQHLRRETVEILDDTLDDTPDRA